MDLEYDENPENPMEIPRIPLKSRESHENPGSTIEIPGVPWKSQKSREYEIRRFPLVYTSQSIRPNLYVEICKP